MSTVDILLLAGGNSSRMGGVDKLLELVSGTPLIRNRAEMCITTNARQVIAVIAPEHPDREAALDGLPIEKRTNDSANLGMAHSLHIGLSSTDADAVLIMLADLPDLTTQDLDMVLNHAQTSKALIVRGATETSKPGHPVLIRRALFPELMALQGDIGAGPVIKSHLPQTELVALPGTNALNDLDTPEAWKTWRAEQKKPLN